jgi:hypothetical protein
MGIPTPFHSIPSGGIAAYMTSCATVDDEPQKKKVVQQRPICMETPPVKQATARSCPHPVWSGQTLLKLAYNSYNKAVFKVLSFFCYTYIVLVKG